MNIIFRTSCSILFLLACLAPIHLYSQAGKDGAEIVTTTGVTFNRYTTLAVTATAGSTSITVASAANLAAGAIAGAANNPYATAALGYGDLIMIIKMQGATINTTNTVNYGTITSANNTGVYELEVVRAVSANLITFCSGLSNNYVVGGTERVQVIRIPRLSTLTINVGASLTATAWSGTFTGGIVALEVNGNAAVNGSITVAGLGFRGGIVDNNTSGAPGGPTNYVNTSSNDGAEKGESIAGFQTDYDGVGRYDRGAPANGGGGGNAHNAGGGGGANGNNGNAWSGQGVMIVDGSNPIGAWQLDPGYIANANALTNSSGGGRGGYSYGSSNQNATTVEPGNALWGGDNRREAGGLGGRPLTYSASTLFFGGGGGAGDGNNTASQNGANGGGIIYLLVTGNLSGSGSINANGANAGPTIGGHNDAPGGGGGGGAINLNVQGTISALSITANGGSGGNQLITTAENEGPGGGGGGGHIRSTGTPTVSVTGGNNGTTLSSAVTEFISNGATRGASGASLLSQSFVPVPALDCFPLPVSLISFEAKLNDLKEGVISWVTDIETDLDGYIIEYSTDAVNWNVFSTTPARNQPGRQLYTVNTGILRENRFYRLRILNRDQSYTYSATRLLTGSTKTTLVVNGNNLLLQGLSPQALKIRLFNSNGNLVSDIPVTNNSAVVIAVNHLAHGVYILKISYAAGQEEVMKFIY